MSEKKILLVDDSRTSLFMESMILRRPHFEKARLGITKARDLGNGPLVKRKPSQAQKETLLQRAEYHNGN